MVHLFVLPSYILFSLFLACTDSDKKKKSKAWSSWGQNMLRIFWRLFPLVRKQTIPSLWTLWEFFSAHLFQGHHMSVWLLKNYLIVFYSNYTSDDIWLPPFFETYFNLFFFVFSSVYISPSSLPSSWQFLWQTLLSLSRHVTQYSSLGKGRMTGLSF